MPDLQAEAPDLSVEADPKWVLVVDALADATATTEVEALRTIDASLLEAI